MYKQRSSWSQESGIIELRRYPRATWGKKHSFSHGTARVQPKASLCSRTIGLHAFLSAKFSSLLDDYRPYPAGGMHHMLSAFFGDGVDLLLYTPYTHHIYQVYIHAGTLYYCEVRITRLSPVDPTAHPRGRVSLNNISLLVRIMRVQPFTTAEGPSPTRSKRVRAGHVLSSGMTPRSMSDYEGPISWELIIKTTGVRSSDLKHDYLYITSSTIINSSAGGAGVRGKRKRTGGGYIQKGCLILSDMLHTKSSWLPQNDSCPAGQTFHHISI